MKYRNLHQEEIAALQNNACTAEDWSQIEVGEGFDASYVHGTAFSGRVRLGRFEKSFTLPGGIKRHSGISDATLHNVTVGDNC